MGGDAKSPQHTSVHPMYVSYSSLPATTSSAVPVAIKNNIFNAYKINSNSSNSHILASHKQNRFSNRNSGASFNESNIESNINLGLLDGEYNEDMDSSNKNETYLLKTINSNKIQNNSHLNDGYIPYPYPNKSTSKELDINSSPEYLEHTPFRNEIQESHSDVQLNPILQQYRQNHELAISINKPYELVTKSPNLNRVSSRRRNERPMINHYDKIRETPPLYNDKLNMSIQRAKSQDRLTYRKQRNNNAAVQENNRKSIRPRSYCSNGYADDHVNKI